MRLLVIGFTVTVIRKENGKKQKKKEKIHDKIIL
jgi:hypothetical protein